MVPEPEIIAGGEQKRCDCFGCIREHPRGALVSVKNVKSQLPVRAMKKEEIVIIQLTMPSHYLVFPPLRRNNLGSLLNLSVESLGAGTCIAI